jgi:hypothetical protein
MDTSQNNQVSHFYFPHTYRSLRYKAVPSFSKNHPISAPKIQIFDV